MQDPIDILCIEADKESYVEYLNQLLRWSGRAA
jgi:predicted O-methyltransferase YrrM